MSFNPHGLLADTDTSVDHDIRLSGRSARLPVEIMNKYRPMTVTKRSRIRRVIAPFPISSYLFLSLIKKALSLHHDIIT